MSVVGVVGACGCRECLWMPMGGRRCHGHCGRSWVSVGVMGALVGPARPGVPRVKYAGGLGTPAAAAATRWMGVGAGGWSVAGLLCHLLGHRALLAEASEFRAGEVAEGPPPGTHTGHLPDSLPEP